MNKQDNRKQRRWIKKQAEVYSQHGFDEPDRLINNLGKKPEEVRFTKLMEYLELVVTTNKYLPIKMADLGCASSAISRYILTKFDNVTITAFDLHRVIDKITYRDNRIRYIAGDLNKPFEVGKNDIIYASEVLEHLYNDYSFIRNCYKCLKQGGYLIITAPTDIERFGDIDSDTLHIRVYPRCMLDNLIKIAGFMIVESIGDNKGGKVIVCQK